MYMSIDTERRQRRHVWENVTNYLPRCVYGHCQVYKWQRVVEVTAPPTLEQVIVGYLVRTGARTAEWVAAAQLYVRERRGGA